MKDFRLNRLASHCLHKSVHQQRLPLPAIIMFILSIFMICGCEKKAPASAMAVDDAAHAPGLSQTAHKKVLVINSYHPEYAWNQALNRGMNLVLSYKPEIEIQHFYMDTKRKTSDAWKQQAAEEAFDIIRSWKPDVIIATDDNAQDLVGRHLSGPGNPPWVFCGVNNDPADYGFPSENTTGVLEVLHFAESMRYFKKIQPEAKKVLFLSDDSITSRGVIRTAKQQLADAPADLEIVDWKMAATFEQWKQIIRDYHNTVDAFAVYTYHTIKGNDLAADSVDPKEVMRWTVDNSSVPVVGFLIFAADDGAFCGVLESAVDQGQIAAEMALKILNGTSPSGIEIVPFNKGMSVLNMKIARKLNIEIPAPVLRETNLVINKQADVD